MQHQLVRSRIEETPERKPYLDSLPLNQDFAKGDIDQLPKPLREKYARYESAWEETRSMRDSRLCHEDDIREQEKEARKLYGDFRTALRSFLGIDDKEDTALVREIPNKGKDWNEQLLKEREEQMSSADDTEENRNVAAGIDLDADGDVELNESEEKKQTHKTRR